MPRLSKALVVHEYNKRKDRPEGSFGPYMVKKYFLTDVVLAQEADDNMAMLRLLKDHVQKEK
tara:strand:- start:768 stop:953 length:186 start_codon:yes stop_codon:yes gene_type:complete